MTRPDPLEQPDVIRDIYQRRLAADEGRAADVASRLHDEGINGGIMPILFELRTLAADADPTMRAQIESIIDMQRTLVGILRGVSETLWPLPGMEEPLALPALLRHCIMRARSYGSVDGSLDLIEIGTSHPIAPPLQRMLARFVDTALLLGLTRLKSRYVTVFVHYASVSEPELRLSVTCDGKDSPEPSGTEMDILVLDMQETARQIGGKLIIEMDIDEWVATVTVPLKGEPV